MKWYRSLLAVVAICGALFIAHPQPAVAAVPYQVKQFAVCGGSSVFFLGLEPWYQCVSDGGRVKIDNLNDVWLIILTILEDAIKLGTYIAAGFIIWGGVKFLKSQGEPGQLSDAKAVIRNAILGLLFTLLAVAIVQFVAQGIHT